MKKEEIKAVLSAGMGIEYSYKRTIESWMSKIQIGSIFAEAGENAKKLIYIVHGGALNWEEYIDIDKAVDRFVSVAFSKDNLAFLYREAKMSLAKDGIYPELDDREEFKVFEKRRQKLVKEFFNK